ncbi:hypothetical protein [Halorussus salinus]|uniref:hypothetical protein n=1 Tax=Halorussus salinus TaxID=1364935 RepID=UPI001092A9FB|nr:hypothetical protein [Halorussus salinus]
MANSKTLAAVCLLFVLVGGSVAFAPAERSRDAVDGSEQVAVPIGPVDSPDAQVIPRETLILRDQSTTFVVRIEDADEGDGITICVNGQFNRPANIEFHSNDVIPLNLLPGLGLVCPGSDNGGYIPAREVDRVESVPLAVSLPSGESFPVGENRIDIETRFKNPPHTDTERFTIRVVCPIGCHLTQIWQTLTEPEILIALLGLLIAFFGRKRIWSVLRLQREQGTGTSSTEKQRSKESTEPQQKTETDGGESRQLK